MDRHQMEPASILNRSPDRPQLPHPTPQRLTEKFTEGNFGENWSTAVRISHPEAHLEQLRANSALDKFAERTSETCGEATFRQLPGNRILPSLPILDPLKSAGITFLVRSKAPSKLTPKRHLPPRVPLPQAAHQRALCHIDSGRRRCGDRPGVCAEVSELVWCRNQCQHGRRTTRRPWEPTLDVAT